MSVTYALIILTCIVGFLPRCTRIAASVVAALLGVQIQGKIPNSANHVFLDFLCLALIGLVDASRGHERELAIKAGRWIVIIVLFYSGLQKLVHGYYFDGQFLAFATATDDRLAFLFRYFLPAAEFDRLLAMGDESLGMGPYRVDSAIFVAISNITYVSEIVIPILMVIRKTRAFATILAVLFVVVVEAGARVPLRHFDHQSASPVFARPLDPVAVSAVRDDLCVPRRSGFRVGTDVSLHPLSRL